MPARFGERAFTSPASSSLRTSRGNRSDPLAPHPSRDRQGALPLTFISRGGSKGRGDSGDHTASSFLPYC